MAETYPPEIPILSDEEFEKIWPKKLLVSAKGTPELTPRRCGKVIIVNEKGDWEILEGVKYSNVDQKWYDIEDNLHPLYEKYAGKKFGLQFMITDKDKEGNEHVYSNIFLSPMLHAEMGPVNWTQLGQMEKFEAEFGIRVGCLSGYEDPYLNQSLKRSGAAYVMNTSPEVDCKDFEPLIIFISLAIYIDELFDSKVVSTSHKIPYAQIEQVMRRIMEVAKGQLDPEESEVDFPFPMLKPLCRDMKYLRIEFRKRCSTEEIYNRFINAMTLYLNAVALKNCKEWNEYKMKDKKGTAVRTHWELRAMDTGTFPNSICQLMGYHNQLPQEISESHLWKHYLKLCQDVIMYSNDLLSYRQEVADGETCNSLLVRHHEQNMDFLDALDSCVVDANKCTLDMMELADFMLKLHKEDHALKQAIYLLKAIGLGGYIWYNYAPRYHSNIVFDQVIYLDDDVMLEQLRLSEKMKK